MSDTTATETETTTSEATSFADAGIGSIFDDLAAETANDAESTEAEPTEGAPEQTEQDQPANDNAAPDDAAIFADDALSTPEGIKTAKARIEELIQLGQRKYAEQRKYDRSLAKKTEKLNRNIEQHKANVRQHAPMVDFVQRNLADLYSGDPERMVNALGALTRQDGTEALNLLNSTLVNRGKPKIDPQIQAELDAYKKQLNELKNERQVEQHRAHVAHQNQQIASHSENLASMVMADSALPHLQHYLNQDREGTLQYLINEITEVDGQIAPATLFREVEKRLSGRYGGSPKGTGGAGATQNKPGPAVQRSPGQSIGPRAAAASNTREPTEEETLRSLANDSSLMASLGF